MQFLIIGKIKIDALQALPATERARLILEERSFALDSYLEGKVRQLWGRDDIRGGVLLIEAVNAEEAQLLADSLPFARAGLLNIELIPLIAYGGFTAQQIIG